MNTRQLTVATSVLIALVLLYGALPLSLDETAAAQTQRRAALIAQFGDDTYVTRCVPFSEESITGLELLTRSGLQLSLWGGAVCRIEQQGCDYPAEPCFCQCKGSSCQYWSYWHWQDGETLPSSGRGAWAYSQIGSGDYRVHDGDIEAWLWGDAQTPPVVLSFAEICRSPGADVGSPAASTQRPSQGVSLAQYAIFAAMAIALVAGFWFVRRRQGV